MEAPTQILKQRMQEHWHAFMNPKLSAELQSEAYESYLFYKESLERIQQHGGVSDASSHTGS